MFLRHQVKSFVVKAKFHKKILSLSPLKRYGLIHLYSTAWIFFGLFAAIGPTLSGAASSSTPADKHVVLWDIVWVLGSLPAAAASVYEEWYFSNKESKIHMSVLVRGFFFFFCIVLFVCLLLFIYCSPYYNTDFSHYFYKHNRRSQCYQHTKRYRLFCCRQSPLYPVLGQ